MPTEKLEIFRDLEPWARETILPFLKPVENCWQPQDFLPEPSTEGFYDKVLDIQFQAKEIPDDYFVCLVGNMITEEALPTYQKMVNTMELSVDDTGVSSMSWAVWSRGWSAEENRHGDLLNKYLYLTGRVDMKMIEKTIQYLIGGGMICWLIASDEKRHEAAYTKLVEKLFEIDPESTVLALASIMQNKIVMPAHLMYDGCDKDLFKNFSAVAQRLQVYTAKDYADILEFLLSRCKVGDLVGLSGEGRRAQEFVCTLAPRIRKLEERAQSRVKESRTMPFSWISGREVVL